MEPMPVGPGEGAELEPPELGFDAVWEAGVVVAMGVLALWLVVPALEIRLLVCGDAAASVTVGAGAAAKWCAFDT
jgi:hypothetical protein